MQPVPCCASGTSARPPAISQMRRFAFVTLLVGTALLGLPSFARAQNDTTSWIGGIGDFQDAANWDGGVPGYGALDSPDFYITNGGTASLSGHIEVATGGLGGEVGGSGALTLLSGAHLDIIRKSGEFGFVGEIYMGGYGTGTLTVNTGAQIANVATQIGYYAGSTGTVFVQGGTITSSEHIHVGREGAGQLTLSDDGTISSATAHIGHAATATGTATIESGTWTNSGDFYIGYEGTGHLDIQQGGSLIVSGDAYLSHASNSNGTANIDGSWSVASTLTIGEGAGASVIVGETGTLTADTILISLDSDYPASSLAINGGTLVARQIAGLSNASVTFDGGTLRFAGDNPGYFIGFDNVEIGGTSVTFDTQQYHVATSTLLHGTAQLIKTGVGRLGLMGVNTYSGGTYLQAGEILMNNGSSLGSGALTMDTAELRSTATATLSLPRITITPSHAATFSTAGNTTLTLDADALEFGADAIFRVGSPGNTGIVDFAIDQVQVAQPGTGIISVEVGTLRAANDQLAVLSSQVSKIFIKDSATLGLNDQTSAFQIQLLEGDGVLHTGNTAATVVSVQSGDFGGLMTGSGSLAKTGSGTLAISGSVTLASPTTVHTGTLLIDGTAGDVVVDGGTLGGTGTADIITLDGGMLAPGSETAAGTLDAVSLVWVEGTLAFRLGETSLLSDHLALSDMLDGENSAYHFQFTNLGAALGTTFDLISFQTSTIQIDQFAVANTDGLAGTFAYQGNTLQFTLTAIPEPGTLGLLAIALLVITWQILQRRAKPTKHPA